MSTNFGHLEECDWSISICVIILINDMTADFAKLSYGTPGNIDC